MEIDDFRLIRLSEGQMWHRESNLAFTLKRKPDINFISADQIRRLPPSLPITDAALFEEPFVVEQASLIFFKEALSQVSRDDVGKTRPYLQKLYDWMQHALELGKESSILLRSQCAFPPYTDSICLERASHLYGSTGELTCLMGENLSAILREEIEPLSLLLQGNLLKDYYSSQDCTTTSYEYACRCIDLIVDHNPTLRVSEIGAGTGGATLPILESLGGQEGKKPRFLKYDDTDISSGFFDAAKERFKPWDSFLRYRILDIEE